jgi:transposase
MAHALLPDPKSLALDNISVLEGVITFHIHTTTATDACPDCGCCSERVHSRYQRTLQDLPWQGNAVRFLLTVRRFFCGNAECKRKIFAEEPANVTRRYRRKTSRLDDLLLQLVWKVGGESAATIARLVGLLLSPDAALYRFKKSAQQNTPKGSPEVLGLDDFVFRKGLRYGTILIDLQTSTPVDLLPNREKATVEKWLKEHPGAKVVSRDRSAVFADAIREGAPEAIHVADRFHLLGRFDEKENIVR